jgi:hypothetical protein
MTMTITDQPPYVTVRYRRDDGTPDSMTGYMHDHQPEQGVALVLVASAAANPHVHCWKAHWDDITGITHHRPPVDGGPGAVSPIMGQLLDAVTLTPWERQVYEILVEHGGPVEWRAIPIIVDEAGATGFDEEPGRLNTVVQGLVAKGRLSIATSPDMTSGVVTIHAA